MGVDGRPGIVARRLGATPLLGTPGLRWRREPGNLDLELAPVARREFLRLGVERLTGDRAHGKSLPLASKRAIVSWSPRGSSELAGVTVTHGTIVKIELLADSTRPRRLDLTGLDD